MTIALVILGIILCICLSAFFSASEMAVSSSNRIRIENEAEAGNRKAKRALKVIDRFDDTLGAILIGNNLVNIAASSLSSVLIILLFGNDEFAWVSTIGITILVIIFGETMPKIAAKQNATRFSLIVAPFLALLTTVLKPLVWICVKLVNLLTSGIQTATDEDDDDESVEELTSIIETAGDEGVLDDDQTELLIAAIDFADISAFEVMTARVDIDAIDIDDSFEDIMELVQNTPYTRLPVYEDSIDNIIGILHLNLFLTEVALNGNADIRSLMLEPVFVYKTVKLPTVLAELRQAKQHMAVVTDEYSGTDGIITIEDVLEEIVGEIWDENDEVEEEVVEKNEHEFELDGDLTISDFLELCDIDEEFFDFDSDTVGGWIMEMLERFPEEGDEVHYNNITLKVIEAGERRVEKALLTVENEEEKDAEDEESDK